jgi:hypothetical protein
VTGEYEEIVGGKRKVKGLAAGDRDRIEGIPPVPVAIDLGTPAFFKKVVVQRLDVLRKRAKLPETPNSLEPLPHWFVPLIAEARNVRIALREVGLLRQAAIQLGHMPTEKDYNGEVEKQPDPIRDDTDFDKAWSNFLDTAPAAVNRLLVPTKTELLHWWVREASKEHLSIELDEVETHALDDAVATRVIDFVLKLNGVPAERRQVALCEAPNRAQQLANQVEHFLAASAGTPIIVRTNGFPKGRQTQVASALHKLRTLSGREIDLNETEWHNLQRARDFEQQKGEAEGFLAWRRNHQWLTHFLSPLQPLIQAPRMIDIGTDEAAQAPKNKEAQPAPEKHHAGPFPVFMGKGREGENIFWAPYREPPEHLNNFGFLITGDAGSGKTQTIRVLIDAACRQSLSVLIFDFKGDYCDAAFAKPLGIEVVDIRTKGLPFNPLQPPPRGASGVQAVEHAHELAGVLARVFKLGAVQMGLLRDAITATYAATGLAPREWVDPDSVNWPTFDLVLERLREEKAGAALVTKLSPLCELGLFSPVSGELSFESFINSRICLNLKDLPTDELKSALAEIIIIQLHGYALRGDQPRRLTRMIVFDEAHRVKDSLRLQTLAREGRAFGVGVVVGTQFPGDIPETMAGNLATQLFLMNNQADHRRCIVKQMYGSTSGNEAKDLLKTLGKLKPFQGLFSNTHYSGALLDVLPHYARR